MHRNGAKPTLERHGHDLGWRGRSSLDYGPQNGNKVAVNMFHLRKGNLRILIMRGLPIKLSKAE